MRRMIAITMTLALVAATFSACASEGSTPSEVFELLKQSPNKNNRHSNHR
ncbi:MAG: hypothetical protein AB1515_07575 [Nitrospirota bacterium]